MGRPLIEPKAPTALVPSLLAFARGHGASASELLARFDIDGEGAEEIAVTSTTLRALFEAVADATFEPALGLRLAATPDLSARYAPVAVAVRSSATVREALECLARYAALVHPDITAKLLLEGDTARWTQTTPRRPRGIGVHADHYALAVVLARCREASRADLTVLGARFAHARPRDTAPLHRFFGTRDLSFGSETSELTFAGSSLRTPIVGHDRHLLQTATELADGALSRHASHVRTSGRVAASLPALLPDRATIDVVAKSLALSVRTLQRRLDQEGTTFVEVLDGVREELARASLRRTDDALVSVAERLGFADLATFSRAFKRWTGQPPGMFRRNGRVR